jgi:putative nucleotidyltransferase with HDIG domain
LVTRKLQGYAWLILLFIGIIGVFAIHYMPEEFTAKEGEISTSTIKAPYSLTFEDENQTAERKRIAAENVGDVYVLDNNVLIDMEMDVNHIFADFNRIIRNDSSDARTKIAMLKNNYQLSDVAANVLLYLETDAAEALKAEVVNLLRTNWREGVRENEVEEKKEKILNQIELLNYNAPYRDLIKAVVNEIELTGNYYYDENATIKAREAAAENEGPVLVTIRKDQKIVGEGEVVTADQNKILQAFGYQRTSSPLITMLGISLFLILIIVLTVLFLKQYRQDIYANNSKIILLSLIFFVIILAAKLIASIRISTQTDIAELVGFLIPVATGSMLISILLDTKLAIFMTMVMSIFVGFLTGSQLPFTVTAFVGGVVGVFSVSRFSQRLDWVKAGLFVAAADAVCIIALALMSFISWRLTAAGVVLGAINGFISAIFAYGSLPFFESGFKLTTSVTLLELSNPNHPLLKRLLLEAPGTYHHSVLVGNLGEAAADAVGADSLLVRVGSYYHDIGKLKRPYFFIENQMGEDNPHEKLTPVLSTLIITSHVKDGLELANEHKIPPVIVELIAQHQGTSIVTYFYHKALEMGNADTVKENDFRYNAEKPQSKEAAIIMLADNVEAAVRSMQSLNTEKIESLVRKIIKERQQDGQLDESDLTFKDIDLIANAFVRVLNGIFHSRIEYPENVLERMEGGTLSDADTDGQPTEPDSGDKGE